MNHNQLLGLSIIILGVWIVYNSVEHDYKGINIKLYKFKDIFLGLLCILLGLFMLFEKIILFQA